jgi:pimeloyl-ACP methyl ester carboxylesterase
MPSTVVLLHGANGTGGLLAPLAEPLRAFASIEAPDLLGPGGRPVPERFTVPAFAADLIAYLDARGVERAVFFGYSFGGYLALYLACRFPERVRALCTLAAKYVFDEAAVKHLTYLADPERLRRPGNPRAQQLEQAHAPQDWVAITNNNRRLFAELEKAPALTEADLQAIRVPALVLSADKDQIVPQAETRALAKLLRARLGIFQGYAHPLAAVPVEMVVPAIGSWLAGLN